MAQEETTTIDQLNEEFEQLSINDSIRMENARIETGQKERP